MMWITFAPIILMVVPLLAMGTESPTWLVNNGREGEATMSLQRLRGRGCNIQPELMSLIENRSNTKHNEDAGAQGLMDGGQVKSSSVLYLLRQPPAYRPLILGILLVMIQQWSGVNAFMFYTSQLFAKAGDTATTYVTLQGSIAVNSVGIVFTLLAIFLMRKAGRRFFMMLSTIGMTFSCGIMGYIYQQDGSEGAKIALVCLYLAFFSMGAGPIVWLVLSEIFPASVRGPALSICVVTNWASAFGVTWAFRPMKEAFTPEGTFWFYGVIMFVGTLYVYFKMPETKDKTLEEIEKMFARN